MEQQRFYIKNEFLACQGSLCRIPGGKAIPIRIVKVDSGIPFDILEPSNADPFLITVQRNGREYSIFDSLTQEKQLEKCSAYCRTHSDTAFIAKRDVIHTFQAVGRRSNTIKFMDQLKATFLAFNQQSNQLAVQQDEIVDIFNLPINGSQSLKVESPCRICELFSENQIHPSADHAMWNNYGQVWYTMQPLTLLHSSVSVQVDGQLERQMFGSISRMLYFCQGRILYIFDTSKGSASYLVLSETPIAVRARRASILVLYHSRIEEFEFPIFVQTTSISITNLLVFSAGLHCFVGDSRIFLDATSRQVFYGANDELLHNIQNSADCTIISGELCGITTCASFQEQSFTEIFSSQKELRAAAAGEISWKERLNVLPGGILSIFGNCQYNIQQENGPVKVEISWAHVDFQAIVDMAAMNVRLAASGVEQQLSLSVKLLDDDINSNNTSNRAGNSQISAQNGPQGGQNGRQSAFNDVSQRESCDGRPTAPDSRRSSRPQNQSSANASQNASLDSSRRTSVTQMDMDRLTLAVEKHDRLSQVQDYIIGRNAHKMAEWLAHNSELQRDQVVQAYNEVCIGSIDQDISANFAQREADLFNLLFQPHYRAWMRLIQRHIADGALGYLLAAVRREDIPRLNDYCKEMFKLPLADLLATSPIQEVAALRQRILQLSDDRRTSSVSDTGSQRSQPSAQHQEGEIATFQRLLNDDWRQAVQFALKNTQNTPGLFVCLSVIFDEQLRTEGIWDISCLDARDQVVATVFWNNETAASSQMQLTKSTTQPMAAEMMAI